MKRRVRPSRILILACFLSVLVYVLLVPAQERRTFAQSVQSEEASARETSVSEVIIEAPWAEKNLYQYAGGEESPPGEFGHYVSQETELGPNSFTVAPNGDIYINDPLNKRIQRFGPNGEFIAVIPIMGGFMCVDKFNNILTTRASRPHSFIDKYDQVGNLLESYPIEMKRKSIVNVYCDNARSVFACFYADHMEIDKGSRTIIDTSWGGICQVGSAAGALSLQEQKSSIKREGFLGSNSAALSKGYFTGDPGKLCFISFGGDTIKTFRSIEGSFFGCDENLNIYTTRYDLENRVTNVKKYDQNGRLVSTFAYRCEKPYRTPAGRGEYLDRKGNVYVFCESYRDGIQVTKWYKVD